MKKSTRYIKKALATFLVVLMSINTFAAVVGDNDGAAFITKAEFDSLKNDFQSQLDTYNSSIDNKIDGAIASYLEGIKLKKAQQKTNLCYFDGKHITSIRENYQDINWKEGLMSINLTLFFMCTAGNGQWTEGTVGVNGESPVAFKELSITSLNRNKTEPDKSRAIWVGLLEKTYTYTSHAPMLNFSWYPGNLAATLYVGPGYGVCGMSDVSNWCTETWGTGSGRPTMIKPAWGTNTTTAWCYGFNGQVYDMSVKELGREFEHIIVNGNNTCRRFTNIDAFTDFSWDKDGYGTTSIHTQWTVGSQLFKKGFTCNVMQINGGNRFLSQPSVEVSNTHQYSGTDSTWAWRRILPFNGFVDQLENWNQIATTDYDTLASTLKSLYNINSYYVDGNGKTHLLICAGAPVYYNESADQVDVVFEVEFVDKTKNYALFLKDVPFVRGLEPSADATYKYNTVRKGSNETDPNATQGAFNNSILVENGKGTYRVTLEPNKCLFMKWGFNDVSVTGGGKLIPPKNVTIYS